MITKLPALPSSAPLRRAARILFASLLATVLTASAGLADNAPNAASKRNPDLERVTVEQVEVTTPVVGTGTIYPDKDSKIGPLVNGQLMKVHVDVGDRVMPGDPLFTIRQDSYRLALDQATARLAVAQAQMQLAEPTLRRAETLFERKSIAEAELDKAESTLAVAKAERAVAEAALAKAQQDLDDTVVTASYPAVVTDRYLDEGIYLSTNLPGSNTAILELQKIDVVKAVIQAPSRELEKLAVGAEARLTIDGISAPIDARVTVINDKIDIATRTVEVQIAIDNPDYQVKPGLFVSARIGPKPRRALLVPRAAVIGPSGSPFVFIAEAGKAVKRSVQVIDFDANRIEVTDGLAADAELLVGPGLAQLTDGQMIGEVGDVAR